MTTGDNESQTRILVCTPALPTDPGDIANIFIWDYLFAMVRSCDVTVLMSSWIGTPGLTLETIRGVSCHRWTVLPSFVPQQCRSIAQLKWFWDIERLAGHFSSVDLIHAHGLVLQGYPAMRLARRIGVPIVVTLHGDPEKVLRKRRLRRFARAVIENADALLAVSDYGADLIRKTGITPRRLFTTYNPVDTALFSVPEGGHQRKKQLLVATRLEEYKGGFRAVRAFANIANDYPDWSLLVVGNGPEYARITEFLDKRPKLRKQIRLTGLIPKQHLGAVMRESRIFVHVSLHEPFGLVVAEAMSTGMPVITGTGVGSSEQMTDFTGVVVNAADVSDIANAMAQVINNYESFDSARIREHVENSFSFHAFASRLDGVYREVLNSRSCQR